MRSQLIKIIRQAVEEIHQVVGRSVNRRRMFEKSWRRNPRKRKKIIDSFHSLYYDASRDGLTWVDTSFLGVKTEKCPLDLWLYQEILYTIRPRLVVETGTRFGGSALFLASICALLDNGQVITIDVDDTIERPLHPRISYVHGSSTSPEVVQAVGDAAKSAGTVLVVLDSDHSREHVLSELQAYSPLVSLGSYIIVEDSNINGHPVLPEFGPGPMEALDAFLATSDDFVIAPLHEKFLFSFSPRGFLKRVRLAEKSRNDSV